MKLTVEAVETMRALWSRNLTNRQIAAETGYSVGTVSGVISGKLGVSKAPRWDRPVSDNPKPGAPGSDLPGPNDPTPEEIAAMCREFRRLRPRPFVGASRLVFREVALWAA